MSSNNKVKAEHVRFFKKKIYTVIFTTLKDRQDTVGLSFVKKNFAAMKTSVGVFRQRCFLRREDAVKKTWLSEMRANCASGSYGDFIQRDFLHQVSCWSHSLAARLTFTQKKEEMYISGERERASIALHTYLIARLDWGGFSEVLACPPRLRFCLRGIRKDVFLPTWCKSIWRTISLLGGS